MAITESRALPYFKWYWQDWRANRVVQRMNYIERGLYRELLDECWAEGGIPEEVEELAFLCDCPVDVMASAWQVLSKCFVPGETDGVLVNARLERERTAKDRERLNRSKAGKKGGRAKGLNAKEKIASASTCLATPSKSHIEEKRREEKSKDQKLMSSAEPNDAPDEAREKIPYAEIRKLYAEILPGLPQVKLFDDARKKAIRSRWNADPRFQNLDFWRKFFEHISKSDFLMGRSSNPWHGCGFDWIFKPANFKKIVEGNYNHATA